MVLRKLNTRTFHRSLYAGLLETVTCLKRDDNQRQGTVRAVKLFDCRWSRITKGGQPVRGGMTSDHQRELHVPAIEMERAGVRYFSALDRFVDKEGRYWQPESGDTLTAKLLENHWCVPCRRVDPPGSPAATTTG